MNRTTEESQPTSTESFNYFNYFTEVEEEFVRRRGKPMFISPLDWALVESWKSAGIPLHVVVRAINEAFDAYDARKNRYRKVNSIFYCEQAVETLFAEYRLAQVGSPQESANPSPFSSVKVSHGPTSAFPKETLLDFINTSAKELIDSEKRAEECRQAEIASAIKRAQNRLLEIANEISASTQVNDEALEHDFDAIDRMMLKAVVSSLSEKELEKIRQEAEAQLQGYKKKIDEKIYRKTVDNFISRRLREMHYLPRLSLFYI